MTEPVKEGWDGRGGATTTTTSHYHHHHQPPPPTRTTFHHHHSAQHVDDHPQHRHGTLYLPALPTHFTTVTSKQGSQGQGTTIYRLITYSARYLCLSHYKKIRHNFQKGKPGENPGPHHHQPVSYTPPLRRPKRENPTTPVFHLHLPRASSRAVLTCLGW